MRQNGSGVALGGLPRGVPGAIITIDGAPGPLNWGSLGLATSLRLGGSEDLRLRSEATRDLTRRWDGEFIS